MCMILFFRTLKGKKEAAIIYLKIEEKKVNVKKQMEEEKL